MHNRHVKFGWKIPSRFGNIATSPEGGIFFDFTLYITEIMITEMIRYLGAVGVAVVSDWQLTKKVVELNFK